MAISLANGSSSNAERSGRMDDDGSLDIHHSSFFIRHVPSGTVTNEE
jgi:hypothetical protein